jgi:hypothetical protein
MPTWPLLLAAGLALALLPARPADYQDLVRRQGVGYVKTGTGQEVPVSVVIDLYTQGHVVPEEGLAVGLQPLPPPGYTYAPLWYSRARGVSPYTPLPWSPAMTPDP